MQVLFKLPIGGSGGPGEMKASHIRVELLLWCVMHGFTYQDLQLERVLGKGMLVTFKQEDLFTLSRLTWQGTDYDRFAK